MEPPLPTDGDAQEETPNQYLARDFLGPAPEYEPFDYEEPCADPNAAGEHEAVQRVGDKTAQGLLALQRELDSGQPPVTPPEGLNPLRASPRSMDDSAQLPQNDESARTGSMDPISDAGAEATRLGADAPDDVAVIYMDDIFPGSSATLPSSSDADLGSARTGTTEPVVVPRGLRIPERDIKGLPYSAGEQRAIERLSKMDMALFGFDIGGRDDGQLRIWGYRLANEGPVVFKDNPELRSLEERVWERIRPLVSGKRIDSSVIQVDLDEEDNSIRDGEKPPVMARAYQHGISDWSDIKEFGITYYDLMRNEVSNDPGAIRGHQEFEAIRVPGNDRDLNVLIEKRPEILIEATKIGLYEAFSLMLAQKAAEEMSTDLEASVSVYAPAERVTLHRSLRGVRSLSDVLDDYKKDEPRSRGEPPRRPTRMLSDSDSRDEDEVPREPRRRAEATPFDEDKDELARHLPASTEPKKPYGMAEIRRRVAERRESETPDSDPLEELPSTEPEPGSYWGRAKDFIRKSKIAQGVGIVALGLAAYFGGNYMVSNQNADSKSGEPVQSSTQNHAEGPTSQEPSTRSPDAETPVRTAYGIEGDELRFDLQDGRRTFTMEHDYRDVVIANVDYAIQRAAGQRQGNLTLAQKRDIVARLAGVDTNLSFVESAWPRLEDGDATGGCVPYSFADEAGNHTIRFPQLNQQVAIATQGWQESNAKLVEAYKWFARRRTQLAEPAPTIDQMLRVARAMAGSDQIISAREARAYVEARPLPR